MRARAQEGERLGEKRSGLCTTATRTTGWPHRTHKFGGTSYESYHGTVRGEQHRMCDEGAGVEGGWRVVSV